MHDIYGTEIYLKHHSEDLMRQAEHERQMSNTRRILAGKEPEYAGKRTAHIQVELIRARHNAFNIEIITGELK